MGIPTICLLDFDFVIDNGQTKTFGRLISNVNMPDATKAGLTQARQTILNKLGNEQKKEAKNKGVYSFVKEQRAAVEDILAQLAQYGIFVVPSGEVESFLSGLGEKKGKRAWFFKIMENLGSNPNAESYVRPEADDVWEFMEQVSDWLANPNRRGMPT